MNVHDLAVEDHLGQMRVEKLAVAAAFLAEGGRPRDFGTDARPALALGGLSHPIIPIPFGPFRTQFLPQAPGHDPPQPPEKVGPVQLGGVLGKALEAVVIPGSHGPQRGVFA